MLKEKRKSFSRVPTLCDPMDCTVHGILQARILEWVAFPFSRGSSQPRDWTQVSWQADSLPVEPWGSPIICLPMQETQVLSLVWEDLTCHGETEPMHHNFRACALEPRSHNYWTLAQQLLKSMCPRACAPQELFCKCNENSCTTTRE